LGRRREGGRKRREGGRGVLIVRLDSILVFLVCLCVRVSPTSLSSFARLTSHPSLPPSLPPSQHAQNPEELSGLIAGIREVEEMFSENIVQAKLNDAGNYEVNLKPEVHLKGKEHEMMTHVDDRLVGDTVMVERSEAPRKEGKEEGGECCGGGCGDKK